MEALSTPDRDSDIFIPQPPSHTHSARLRKRQSEMTLSTTTPPVTMATRRISLPSAPVTTTTTTTPPLISSVSSATPHMATPPAPPISTSESSKYLSTESQDPVSSLSRVKRSATPITPSEGSTERGQQEEEGDLVGGKVEGGEEEKTEAGSESQLGPGSPPATPPVSSAPLHGKPHRSVAVIQPTQVSGALACPPPARVSGVSLTSQHHTQTPVGSPPADPPPPPHCYGAIGPPLQSRRGSIPMATTGRSRMPHSKD